MTAPDIRAQAVELLARALFDAASGGLGDTDEPFDAWASAYRHKAAPYVDALAEAGLLPTAVEWAVRFERQADPTMDNPSGVITQTMTVRDEAAARQAVRNGAPISNATNRRVCSRPVGGWAEVGE